MICYKVREAMRSIESPEISRTPGEFAGAQYPFADLLYEKIERLVVS